MRATLTFLYKKYGAYVDNINHFLEESTLQGETCDHTKDFLTEFSPIISTITFTYKSPEIFSKSMLYILTKDDIYDENHINFNLFLYGCNDLSKSRFRVLRDINKKFREIIKLDFDEDVRGDAAPCFIIKYLNESNTFWLNLTYQRMVPPCQNESYIYFLVPDAMREFFIIQYGTRISSC